MSKEIIMHACNKAQQENYVWELYYFRINRKRNNPYMTYKVRFKSTTYLSEYANSLLQSVQFFQLQEISDVQAYNGENTKISCDKISLSDELIKPNWDLFYTSIVHPCEERFKGNVQGYFLTGKPTTANGKSITFFKVGNPIIKLSNNKAHFYRCKEDELDIVTDEYCRLYLTTDFIIYNDTIYTFNLNFEKIFNLEKTTLKIKENGIEAIMASNSISDPNMFVEFAKEYKSAKTFITLKSELITTLQDINKRNAIATKLGINLDNNDNFIIDTKEKAQRFIKYLCYKIIQEAETNDLLEVSNASKVNIG